MPNSEDLLRRLCAAFGKKLTEDEAALYLEKLDGFPYEQARRGVEQIITNPGEGYDAKRFPVISRVISACSAAGNGYVNGQRVSPNKPWHLTEAGQRALERQERILLLDDDDYAEIITCDDADGRDRLFREAWAKIVRRALGDDVRPNSAPAYEVAAALRKKRETQERLEAEPEVAEPAEVVS